MFHARLGGAVANAGAAPGTVLVMPDESTQSIVIDASPAAIMGVIADFENYPSWADAVKRARVTAPGEPGSRARRVAFELDAGVLRDQYELEYTWGETRVSWILVNGQMMRGQHGSYILEAMGPDQTLVTYSLTVDLIIPMLGMLRRKAERVVMDTALKQLKRRVEAQSARPA
jgi:hypothetical protein